MLRAMVNVLCARGRGCKITEPLTPRACEAKGAGEIRCCGQGSHLYREHLAGLLALDGYLDPVRQGQQILQIFDLLLGQPSGHARGLGKLRH